MFVFLCYLILSLNRWKIPTNGKMSNILPMFLQLETAEILRMVGSLHFICALLETVHYTSMISTVVPQGISPWFGSEGPVRDGTHVLLYYIRTKLIASVYYNWSESESKEYVCIGAARSPGREVIFKVLKLLTGVHFPSSNYNSLYSIARILPILNVEYRETRPQSRGFPLWKTVQ